MQAETLEFEKRMSDYELQLGQVKCHQCGRCLAGGEKPDTSDDKKSLLVELKSEKARCDQLEQNSNGLRDQLEKLRKEFNCAKNDHKRDEGSCRLMIQDLKLENHNLVLEAKNVTKEKQVASEAKVNTLQKVSGKTSGKKGKKKENPAQTSVENAKQVLTPAPAVQRSPLTVIFLILVLAVVLGSVHHFFERYG